MAEDLLSWFGTLIVLMIPFSVRHKAMLYTIMHVRNVPGPQTQTAAPILPRYESKFISM